MNNHFCNLDRNRLELVRNVGSKVIAQCPACAVDGNDKKGEHLVIYTDGAFGCIKFTGQHEESKKHRKTILDIAGIGLRNKTHACDSQWRERRVRVDKAELDRRKLVNSAQNFLHKIVERNPWPLFEVVADSPQRKAGNISLSDPRLFLGALFRPHDLIWTGAFADTGTSAKRFHWKTCMEWCSQPAEGMGPMVTPATWKPNTFSRSTSNVQSAPYVVLDFDEFEGKKPVTSADKQKLQTLALSVTRWLCHDRQWQLAAIVNTGGKGVHCWFHKPSNEALRSLKDVAGALGLDRGLIENPEHACRLPGQIHEKTGVPSSIFWLQLPI